MKEFSFDFENLRVYQKSLDFVDGVFDIVKQLPQEYRHPIGDNFIRAALSIPNNLAEGNDKLSVKEKCRYFRTSKDSTRECVSILIVLHRRRLIGDQLFNDLKLAAKELTSMIYGLTK